MHSCCSDVMHPNLCDISVDFFDPLIECMRHYNINNAAYPTNTLIILERFGIAHLVDATYIVVV